MESNNKQEVNKPQKFYFNNQGKLIVESNSGVWADGEQFCKMYGIFTCNAKTMGEIIHRIQGMPVEIGVKETLRISKDELVDELLNVNQHTIQHYCVLGASKARIREYEESLAKQHYTDQRMRAMCDENQKLRKDLRETSAELNDASDDFLRIKKTIERYNNLPWWKRMFTKVEV